MNILIVEDHELTRFGLKTAFDTETVYEAGSAEQAIEIFNKTPIDVVIMDLGLPQMNGIDATKQIRSSGKDAKVVILTSHNDEKQVLDCLKAGANAYCSKEINPKRLVEVVHSVADGAAWFDPAIADIVLRVSVNAPAAVDAGEYDLTARETEILKLIAKGYNNQKIAETLEISVNTIKVHIAGILRKLEVDDRLQAALKAVRQKIV